VWICKCADEKLMCKYVNEKECANVWICKYADELIWINYELYMDG
jgi:ABC-type iron transport system FetAB ATPase subunit